MTQVTQMITQNYMTLTPAYGRDYRSAKAVKEDFLAGKDFVLNTPMGSTNYSIRDFAPYTIVNLRYKAKTMIAPFTVPS